MSAIIVISGLIAGLCVPRLLQSIERGKAAESLKYLECVRDAQQRYHADHGTFSDDLRKLDLTRVDPIYFAVDCLRAGSSGSLNDTWSLALTRSDPVHGFGAYTVTYTERGFDAANSTIDPGLLIQPE